MLLFVRPDLDKVKRTAILLLGVATDGSISHV
jgi:hypothetical protein